MMYKILADLIVVVHFLWIVFVVAGFGLTAYGCFAVYIPGGRRKDAWRAFFDRWIFRSVHLCGVVYVGLLAILREYCPLTILENTLRGSYDAEQKYPGAFLANYIEKLVYPNVNPLLLVIATVVVAVFTVVMFIVRPPGRIKDWIGSIKSWKKRLGANPEGTS